MYSNDAGNTGTGGIKTDTDELPITIEANADQPPVNHLPTQVTTPMSTAVTLSVANANRITVTDRDAGSAAQAAGMMN